MTDERTGRGTAAQRASPFVEKISTWLVLIAALGGFIVLLDPALSGKVLGFDWKIGVGEFSPELKGAVVNTMLLGGFSGVIAFWLGATKSQERTTDSLSRIAEVASDAVVQDIAPKVAAAVMAAVKPGSGGAAPPKVVDTLNVDASGADISITDGNIKESK